MKQSLAGKTAWSAVSVVVLTAGRFAAGITVARTLGPQLSGQAVYLLWLADSLSMVASLGLHSTVTRFTAELYSQNRRLEADTLLRWAFVRYGAMQLAASIVLTGALPYAVRTPASWTLRLFLLIYAMSQASTTFVTAWLAGMQRFDWTARLNAVSGVLLAGAVAVGCRWFGLNGAVLGYAIGAMPAVFVICRQWRLDSRYSVDFRMDKELRSRAGRYGLFTCFAAVVSAFVWSRTEIYFLTRCSGFHAVAMYNVGLSLSSMANQAAVLLTSGLVPHFAALAGSGELGATRRSYAALTRLVALVVFPLSFGFAALAPVLVPLLYGAAFADAVPAACFLAILSCFSAGNVGSALVYGREKSWFVACSGLFAAVLAVAGGTLIVPVWGVAGAVASRAAVQCIAIGLGTWYIQTRLGCAFPWAALLKTISAAVAAAVVGRLTATLCPGPSGLLISIVAMSAMYSLMVRSLSLLRDEDAAAIRRMLPLLPGVLARPAQRATDWLAGMVYRDANHLFVQ
jgi:O-antigen/teichoic acid export membrane protein